MHSNGASGRYDDASVAFSFIKVSCNGTIKSVRILMRTIMYTFKLRKLSVKNRNKSYKVNLVYGKIETISQRTSICGTWFTYQSVAPTTPITVRLVHSTYCEGAANNVE